MDEPELDPGSLLLAQGFHGAWFPARVVQAHSTSVLVALQSDVEEHSEWVALGSGRLATLERCLSADTVLCSGCIVNKDEELVLLCDGCNLGMHTYCLEPPLAAIPDGQWFCKGCAAAIAAARKACPAARKRPLPGGGGGGGGGGGERPLKEARTTTAALIGESPFAGRCERSAWCVRGFKHGGRGGICSDRAALNPHQPSSSAAPSASSPSSASASTSATAASSMSPAGKGPASPRAERSPTRPRAAAASLLSVHAITPELSLRGGGGAPTGAPTASSAAAANAADPAAAAAAATASATPTAPAAASSAAASSAASAAADATAALPSRELTAFRVCGCEPPHLTAPLRAGGAGGAGFGAEHLQGLQLEGLLAGPARVRLRVTPEQVEMRMHRVHPDEGPRHTRHSRDVGPVEREQHPRWEGAYWVRTAHAWYRLLEPDAAYVSLWNATDGARLRVCAAVANAAESCRESEGYVVFLERLLTAGVRECDLFGSAAFIRRHLRRLCTPPPPATAAATAAAAGTSAAAAERTSRPTSPCAPSTSSLGVGASRGALRPVAPLRELLHALRQFERAQAAQAAAVAAATAEAAAVTAAAGAAGEAPQGAAAEASGAVTAAKAPAVAAVALATPPVLLELNLIVPAEDAGSRPHGTRGGEGGVGGEGGGGGRVEGAPTDIVAYEAGQEWMVEAILEQRAGAAGEIEYLVKWQQWTEEHNTWEPEANLGGCVELLSAFHASVASSAPSSSGAPVTSAGGGVAASASASASAAAGGAAVVAGDQDGPSAVPDGSALDSSAVLQAAPAAEKSEGGGAAQAKAAAVGEGLHLLAVPSGGGGEEAAVEAAAGADSEEHVKAEIGEEQQPGSMLLGSEGEGEGARERDGDGVDGGDRGEEDDAEAEAEAATRLVLQLPAQLGNPSEVPHAAAARSIGRRGGRGARGRGRGRTPPPATDLQYVLVGLDLVMCGVAGWAARAEELARGPEPPDAVASGGGYGGGGFGGGYGSGSYGGSSNDGPDAERRRLVEAAAAGFDPDQCERNSQCTRGFKHRGFGGHCRLPAGASKPSKKGARHATLLRLRHADALLPCDEATPDDDLWRKRRSSTKRVSWAPLPPPRTPPSSPPPGEEGGEEGEEEGEAAGDEYSEYDSGTDRAAAGGTGGGVAAGYTSQCERNPECKRGFRHGGWGGRCSFTSSGGSGRRKRRGGASQIAASAEYDRVQALEEAEATARALARGQDGALEEGVDEEAEEAVMDEAAMEVDQVEAVVNGSGAAAAVAAAAGGAASAGLVGQVAVPMEVDGGGEREAGGGQVGMPPIGVAEAVQRGAALPPSKPSLPPPPEVSAGEIAPAAGEIVQAEPLFDLPPELVVPVRMGEQPPGEQQPSGTAAAVVAAVAGRGLDCQ